MSKRLDDEVKRLSIPVESLNHSDKELTRFLSFNPLQNYRSVVEKDLKYKRSDVFDPDREFVIPTDRTSFRGYNKIYSYYFNGMRDHQLDVMEIGAEHSYGILAWARYFRNSSIYSVEMRPNLFEFQDEMYYIKDSFPEEYSRMKVLYNFISIRKEDWSKRLADNKFDIIIDDGSHQQELQLKTLEIAFSYLKEKGMYFIEDIQGLSEDSILYQYVKKMKDEKIIKEISIFHHTNPYRENILKMSRHEKISYFKKRGFTEEKIQRRLRYNEPKVFHMIALVKG